MKKNEILMAKITEIKLILNYLEIYFKKTNSKNYHSKINSKKFYLNLKCKNESSYQNIAKLLQYVNMSNNTVLQELKCT